MDPSIELQLRLHMDVLVQTIHEQEWSLSKVEAKLGWEHGTLAAMLRDPALLLYGDILQILDAVGVEPRVYFVDVARRM